MDEIIRLAVLLIAAIIGRYLVPLIRTRIGVEKLTFITAWISTFVRAAEQTVVGEKRGEDKKEMVSQMVCEKLKELKIDMTAEDINALIEEAVNVMNNESTKEE